MTSSRNYDANGEHVNGAEIISAGPVTSCVNLLVNILSLDGTLLGLFYRCGLYIRTCNDTIYIF